MPEYNYNSVFLTKFRNGEDFLSYHSDNEPEICSKSHIITISFGASRTIKFRPKNYGMTPTPIELQVNHGELYQMSRESQDIFQHSVPKNDSTDLRISVTLRLIQPLKVHSTPSEITPHSQCNETPSTSAATIPPSTSSRPTVLYVSSSMFSGLDSSKLSTASQNATVLFYRGASVEQIHTRLKIDPIFLELHPKSVSNIFVLCGTNNVDGILGIPFSHCSKLINMQDVQQNNDLLTKTMSGCNLFHQFLRSWNPDAAINFVNLLPRTSRCRNVVINQLNNNLNIFCNSSYNTNFISTELDRKLFTWDSYRRNDYFSNSGTDNVHLNRKGVIRLSKHLKYLAHN